MKNDSDLFLALLIVAAIMVFLFHNEMLLLGLANALPRYLHFDLR